MKRYIHAVSGLPILLLLSTFVSAQDLSAGKTVYLHNCAQCHGVRGSPYKPDPNNSDDFLRDPMLSMPVIDTQAAPAAEFQFPRPRDFTKAVYKFRTTPSEQIPTRDDLIRTVKEGLPGSGMPSWKKTLGERQIGDVVDFIMSLSPRFKTEKPTHVLTIGKPPEATPAALEEGRFAYLNLGCVNCHGLDGRGDGAVGLYRRDKIGDDILSAADLRRRWNFRGGSRMEDIYRDLMTGLTLMPSFADALGTGSEGEKKIWHLALYVHSLSKDQPNLQDKLMAVPVAKAPDSIDDPVWNSFEAVDIPLAGQILQPPRYFNPTVKQASAKVAYDSSAIAFLLEWDDPRENYDPADMFELQFPMIFSPDSKPYFFEGDPKLPANLWRWDAKSKKISNLKSTGGFSRKSPISSKVSFATQAKYSMGAWHLLIKRKLSMAADTGISFTNCTNIPIAFAAWDGDREPHEDAAHHSISAWYTLELSSACDNSPHGTIDAPPKLQPATPAEIIFRNKSVKLAGPSPYFGYKDSKPDNYSKVAAEGKSIYFQKCFFCHGDNLDGTGQFANNFRPHPADLHDPALMSQTDEYYFWRIAKGGMGLPPESHPWDSAMPAFERELTQDQIWKVISFLRQETAK